MYLDEMGPTRRINVALDEEHALRLTTLAEHTHVQEGVLARLLLSAALDGHDPDRITDLLDAMPGAGARTQEGIAQAGRGEGTALNRLT
jgi:hypothetical protein